MRLFGKGCKRCGQRGDLYRGYCTGCVGSHTAEEWAAILRASAGRCYYCKNARDLTKDHIVPLSRGGRNEAHNLVACCERCNQAKGDKLLRELKSNWFL